MDKFTRDGLETIGNRVVKRWLQQNEKIRLNYSEQNSLMKLIADACFDVQRHLTKKE